MVRYLRGRSELHSLFACLTIISLTVSLVLLIRTHQSTTLQRNELRRWLEQEAVWGLAVNTWGTTIIPQNDEQSRLKNVPMVMPTWEDFQKNANSKTGNPLIDGYGLIDNTTSGENGRGMIFTGDEKTKVDEFIRKYSVNVYASDLITLNRKVPESRPSSCKDRPLLQTLLTASIIIPFYDEWPSLLLRTIYSIVNRTPRKLLHEIILVDDNSTLDELKYPLEDYLDSHFPKGLVKLVRLPERLGLINARMRGFTEATGDVIVIFDSHMEVNIDWLEPLIDAIARDRKTVAMSTLDYINRDTLVYNYDKTPLKYGFDWQLSFFGGGFRDDELGQTEADTLRGNVMVGTAFAVERQYFKEIGAYDEKMKIWGGENLEFSWRVWLCGGRLIHIPCSCIGHVTRPQPYSFPGGRDEIVQFNYKRAVEVWMEPQHKELVYNGHPKMKAMDVGDLSERIAIKNRLQCRPFSWLLKNITPELFVLSEGVRAWGSARNVNTSTCLDNHGHLYRNMLPLYNFGCHYGYATQGFAITNEGYLRTNLHCVVVKKPEVNGRPMLEGYMVGSCPTWTHTKGSFIQHTSSGLCLDLDDQGPVLKTCNKVVETQKWQFNTYV